MKLLPKPMDFPWVGTTISNRAEQKEPQGHVSGSKEHTELDKSELATRLTTATGVYTPALERRQYIKKERALS